MAVPPSDSDGSVEGGNGDKMMDGKQAFDKIKRKRGVCSDCYLPTRDRVMLPSGARRQKNIPNDTTLVSTGHVEKEHGTTFCECGLEDGNGGPRIYKRPLTKERAKEVARNIATTLQRQGYDIGEDDLAEEVGRLESQDNSLSEREDGELFPTAVANVLSSTERDAGKTKGAGAI